MSSRRPATDEYNAFYATYVDKVGDGDILEILTNQLATALDILTGIPLERHDHRYAEGKWSAKEVVGHLLDTEWIFTYRALCIARGETNPLPGMDQDVYMAGSNFDRRSMTHLLEELRHLRSANLALFASFGDTELDRRGTASGFPITVRALLYIIAGHMEHHLGVLQEKYC